MLSIFKIFMSVTMNEFSVEAECSLTPTPVLCTYCTLWSLNMSLVSFRRVLWPSSQCVWMTRQMMRGCQSMLTGCVCVSWCREVCCCRYLQSVDCIVFSFVNPQQSDVKFSDWARLNNVTDGLFHGALTEHWCETASVQVITTWTLTLTSMETVH